MTRLRILVVLLALTLTALAHAQTAEWMGYPREDLKLSGRAAFVVSPHVALPGRPWIWRARFFGHEPQTDLALLARGFHLVYADVADLYGNDVAMQHYDATYRHVTAHLGLSKKVALECMSRGGLISYRWAAAHPEALACIYADAPVCDIKSWPKGGGRGKGSASCWKACLLSLGLDEESAKAYRGNPIDVLEPLAKARVPLLHVCGDADDVVPMDENTGVLMSRYRALNGPIRVIIKPDVGHHPHSLKDPSPIVAFILRHTVGSGDYFVLRDGLSGSRDLMITNKKGRVAFLGGSITHNPGWRDLVSTDLSQRLKGVDLEFINAGIPSFGSTPGAFRLQRDVLSKGPIDLLFVEAAVNDATNRRTPLEILRGMEGIVRHARAANPAMGLVMLHFVDPEKMERINRGEVPPVIAIHERVAEHYGVPSLDLATEVTERIAAGEFTWKEDFKDLHPSPFGQRLYAASVGRLLDAAWPVRSDKVTPGAQTAAASSSLPKPLDPASYTNGRYVALGEARWEEGWALDEKWRPTDGKGTRAGFVNVPMLIAQAPLAVATLPFRGNGVGVFVAAGADAGVLEASLDGGPWQPTDLLTPWSRGLHLPWAHVLFAGLPAGDHILRVRLAAQQPQGRGDATARIAWFLVNE